MGVGDDQLEVAFQDGMDRLPVNPGTLHADMRHAVALQPIPHRLQIPRHRRKRPDLLVRLAASLPDQHTGRRLSVCPGMIFRLNVSFRNKAISFRYMTIIKASLFPKFFRKPDYGIS